MSQHLTLEISDAIYTELQKKAEACGLSLSDWATSVLSDQSKGNDSGEMGNQGDRPEKDKREASIGVVHTERGLTIAGTRITLYQLMDYIHADYPRHLIRHQFHITDKQFDAAMTYIDQHYEAVEDQYQMVVQQAEENRRYWEAHNQERIDAIAQLQPPPEYQKAWEKLQTRKAQREKVTQ